MRHPIKTEAPNIHALLLINHNHTVAQTFQPATAMTLWELQSNTFLLQMCPHTHGLM